jgi:hypothetical protein
MANVVVNGVSYTVAFIPTPDDSTPGTAAVSVALKSGSDNTIVFEAYNGGWGEFLLCFIIQYTARSTEVNEDRPEYRPCDGSAIIGVVSAVGRWNHFCEMVTYYSQ